MKIKNFIITSALVLSCSVQANNFAEADNIGGGKIIITTDVCSKDSSMSKAYNYTKEGLTEDGCWKYDSDTVIVQWDVTGRRRYPIFYFSLLNEYRKFKSF